MRIVTVRRISQTFFFLLFLWFCIVASFGAEWRQLRGWPVNWLLQLDPLVGLATVLSTGALYAGLLWGVLTLALTVVLGRFFCGWVCPFGSIHHFMSCLGRRGKPLSEAVSENQHSRRQSIKYYLLFFLLAAASVELASHAVRSAMETPLVVWIALAFTLVFSALTVLRLGGGSPKTASLLLLPASAWTLLFFLGSINGIVSASLLTGVLDPIPLLHRSVNLVLLPLFDGAAHKISVAQRYYEGAWLIGAFFIAMTLLNLKKPRFYCRVVCPLGALYGLLSRFALWRIGKNRNECIQCKLCEAGCEGGCNPSGKIRLSECVLCMNCRDECRHDIVVFGSKPSASGEAAAPDISRRGFVAAVAAGVALTPALRLEGDMAHNWPPSLLRPPGALPEEQFLARCVKCGQCMRICPTNIVQPVESGVEALWTPSLNFRIGSSGCQMSCIACSLVCPTAAIRPITLDEKTGRGAFADAGPIRLGTAFVDRGRCLPWAMDKPCIVCQENCPVSPKAIFVKERFSTVRGGVLSVRKADASLIELSNGALEPGAFSTGDHYVKLADEHGGARRRIAENSAATVRIAAGDPFDAPPAPGSVLEIQVRLQQPQVDVKLCVGCGVCEHECPVSGKRAIRVTAENESRNRKRSRLL